MIAINRDWQPRVLLRVRAAVAGRPTAQPVYPQLRKFQCVLALALRVIRDLIGRPRQVRNSPLADIPMDSENVGWTGSKVDGQSDTIDPMPTRRLPYYGVTLNLTQGLQ
jgi:hypothetical protein